jgi:acyl carrier protein
MSEIEERAKKIIAEQLFVDPDDVLDTANFIDDLGADSLDMVELVLKFENEFGFEISDDAVESVVTVAAAVSLLERNAVS